MHLEGPFLSKCPSRRAGPTRRPLDRSTLRWSDAVMPPNAVCAGCVVQMTFAADGPAPTRSSGSWRVAGERWPAAGPRRGRRASRRPAGRPGRVLPWLRAAAGAWSPTCLQPGCAAAPPCHPARWPRRSAGRPGRGGVEVVGEVVATWLPAPCACCSTPWVPTGWPSSPTRWRPRGCRRGRYTLGGRTSGRRGPDRPGLSEGGSIAGASPPCSTWSAGASRDVGVDLGRPVSRPAETPAAMRVSTDVGRLEAGRRADLLVARRRVGAASWCSARRPGHLGWPQTPALGRRWASEGAAPRVPRWASSAPQRRPLCECRRWCVKRATGGDSSLPTSRPGRQCATGNRRRPPLLTPRRSSAASTQTV